MKNDIKHLIHFNFIILNSPRHCICVYADVVLVPAGTLADQGLVQENEVVTAGPLELQMATSPGTFNFCYLISKCR